MNRKNGTKTGVMEPILPDEPVARTEPLDWLLACVRQEQQAEDSLLKGIAAQGESFYKGSLKSVELSGCSFHDCDFEKASFVDVLFRGCDFSGSRLTDCYFHRCAFLSVKGVGADFHESLLKEVRLEDCVFSYANFSGTSWESALLRDCDLQDSYLEVQKHGVEGIRDFLNFSGTDKPLADFDAVLVVLLIPICNFQHKMSKFLQGVYQRSVNLEHDEAHNQKKKSHTSKLKRGNPVAGRSKGVFADEHIKGTVHD